MIKKVLSDVLFGGLIVGAFSYVSLQYETEPEYLKILAFLWGVPLIFFYLLYISWKTDRDAMLSFTMHALLGTMITLFTMIITLYTSKMGMIPTVVINLMILVLAIVIYFRYNLYKLF
jgi:hypothetical protein